MPFETYEDDVWKVFYARGFGDIALARADFHTARQYFSQSLELARNTRHEWAMVYALTGLGRSELGLKNIAAVGQYFREALQLAFKIMDPGITMVALAGYAELLRQEGKPESAIQVASLVSGHYAAWRETRDAASALLTALKKSVNTARFKQAQKKGQARDLQETVAALIAGQTI
jgi:predicted negative regulator of RcsB-dependent stress response